MGFGCVGCILFARFISQILHFAIKGFIGIESDFAIEQFVARFIAIEI